ncbi:MAG TPA: metallophosphoesterase [Nitrososphaera sp.]|nr:metallophosphoesterase [Nitrososphaera sp.]
MKVRPLYPHAALLVEDDRRYIVVTDLHIGLEAELINKGISMPSIVPSMADQLLQLVEREQADAIVLLGDVKHSVSSISKQEWDEIPVFFRRLVAKADVYVVPGNHDGNIRHLLPPNVISVSVKGMTIGGDTLLVHGHSMPSDVRSNVTRIIMGHVHPVFVKRGSTVNGERVWIYMQARRTALFPSTAEEGTIEIIVVPSFNPHLYVSGDHYYKKSISPIITRVIQSGVDRCVVATLDGSVVGDVAMLQNIL